MGVAYLVPTLGRPSLSRVEEDNRAFSRPGDIFATSTEPGMGNALRIMFSMTPTAQVVRNCADDDRYPPGANRAAAEVMESSDIDVLVTGGIKRMPDDSDLAICVPLGANYGSSVDDVGKYGACGSGLFMRRAAVEKHGLLDYDGRRIDNFIVLKAISLGAKVRFCRLNTYWHRFSLAEVRLEASRVEKLALYTRFGVTGKPQPYETPAIWDGAFA